MSQPSRILSAVLALVLLNACTVAPKGDYTRTEIDRPYALPDDVAKVSAAGLYRKMNLVDPEDSVTGKAESEQHFTPRLQFENSISDSFTWIFPIGFKWQIFTNGTHTVGISAFTLLLYNSFSADYWLRLHENWSLRPYYRTNAFDFLWASESRKFGGLEVVNQTSKYLALRAFWHKGEYTAKSELVDIIVGAFTNDDEFTTEVTGDFWGAGGGVIYSLNDKWDLHSSFSFEEYDVGFILHDIQASAGFNFYW